jgi:hypothetical protein
MKGDQEPALQALMDAAKTAWGQEIIKEQAPKGESKSNGEVERAVQEVQGIARTLKESVEQGIKAKLESKAAVLAWLVEYAGKLYNMFHVGVDGMTPYRRMRGRDWRIESPAFVECMKFTKKNKT